MSNIECLFNFHVLSFICKWKHDDNIFSSDIFNPASFDLLYCSNCHKMFVKHSKHQVMLDYYEFKGKDIVIKIKPYEYILFRSVDDHEEITSIIMETKVLHVSTDIY